MRRLVGIAVIATLLTLIPAGSAVAAPTLVNGDFETGDFSGWSFFTLPINSTIGTPAVVSFDIDGDGVATNSARFNVGEAAFLGYVRPGRGGGIAQRVSLDPGTYDISVDVAVETVPSSSSVVGPGFFKLQVDGVVVDSRDFPDQPTGVGRATLNATVPIDTPGQHAIRVRITRRALSPLDIIRHYVDNVVIAPTDTDVDGVPDVADECAETALPDEPTVGLKGPRFAATANGDFDSGRDRLDGMYTLADTHGCSGTQIIELEGLGRRHVKFGISRGALKRFIASLAGG